MYLIKLSPRTDNFTRVVFMHTFRNEHLSSYQTKLVIHGSAGKVVDRVCAKGIAFVVWRDRVQILDRTKQTFLAISVATCCQYAVVPWWRHQMETFSALLAICAENSPVPGEFPAQRPVTQSFDVFFDVHPNIRLSKQWWGWWFETPSYPLWDHRNYISIA